MRFLFRLRVKGKEHLPREGGYVLSANHVSNLDPWPLGWPLFPHRELRFMAKAELFRSPLWPILKFGGAFKVNRGEGDEKAIDTAVRLARDGEVVAIFPEGTRREKGLVKKFEARPHTGAARVALAAGVPLVPAAISGPTASAGSGRCASPTEPLSSSTTSGSWSLVRARRSGPTG